jgi:hypothetical protein
MYVNRQIQSIQWAVYALTSGVYVGIKLSKLTSFYSLNHQLLPWMAVLKLPVLVCITTCFTNIFTSKTSAVKGWPEFGLEKV